MGTRRTWLVGLGLDGEDGHVRVTKGRDFRLLGGSKETHARMQDHAMRMQAELKQRGKRLAEVGPNEWREIAGRIGLAPDDA